MIIIGDNAWNKLTADQQAVLIEAGKITMAYNQEISEAAEQAALDTLIANGCNVVYVEDKAPWAEACSAVIAKSIVGYEDLYQQLLDLAG